MCWQVVSELGKHNTAQSQSVIKDGANLDQHKAVSSHLLSLTGLGFALALLPLSIYAEINPNSLPTGATVTQGSAQFNQNNNTLNINQNTQNLSTNWNSFNIGQDATVNFNQPNSSSIAINRVLDSNASQIMGRLNANGQIFLLNPNGVVFSKTAQVNVGGIVASTLNLADSDLTQGKFTLKNNGSAGSIENYGSIIAHGGVVALIAPVVNNQGSIQNNGTGTNVVHLTAADQVSLQLQDGRLTEYKIDLGTLQGLVDNGGAIQANNGAVYLTAKAKDSLSKAVVNHTGIIEANRLSQNAKGEIILLGDMQNGITTVSGILKAEGKNGADGGFIETSAAQVQIQDTAKVSTLSDGGKVGNYLIDPFEMTITNGGPDTTANSISASYLQNLLQTSTVTLNTDGANKSQSGDINVNADVTWGSANSLILTAYNNINIGANMDGGSILLNGKNVIQTAGAVRGGLIFNTSGNVILSSVGNSINSIGGNVGGNLNLVTQIALANYQALTVAGNLSLVSSRDVTLTNVGNSFSSLVNINARNTQLTASSALTLGVIDVDSLIVYAPTIKLPTLLNTVGLQVLKGNIELMGDTHLTSTLGLIQLSGTLNGKYALTINTTSDVIFDGNVGNSIALQSLNVNGLGMTNGDITTIGDITFNKVLKLQGNTTLRSISGDINTATISTQSSTNNLNLSASSGAIHINGDISANQISIFAKIFSGLGINGLGDLNINTHESLIQSSGYTVGGSAQITSDNNITLASTNNQFGKKVALTGHDITLNNTTNLELDTVNATGDLVATTINGDIFQSALLKIDGNTSFSASGNITLINSMNDFVGTISAYGKNILISDVNLLNLKSISADYLTVRAGSDLSLNGVINVDKDINLSSNGKFINNEGASALNSSQGRWLIYLNNIESGHSYNNLDSNNKAILGVNGSSNIGESGNRYIFSENLDINLTTLDKIKNYGETIDLIDAYKVEGLLSGVEGAYKGHSLDDALNNSLKVGLDIHSAGTNVLADVNANPYKIEIFPTNFNNKQGYNLNLINAGILKVIPKDITVTANGGTSIYGDTNQVNPNFNASGLVNGETAAVLTGLNNSFGINNTTNAGSYSLTVDGTLTNGNYNITQRNDGTWVVGKKDITVTANSNHSAVYNGKDQSVTGFTATGLVNGETESVLTGVTASGTGKNAGSYSSKATGSDNNYNLTFIDGSLDIAKANATVIANSNHSAIYNGKDQTVTGFTATGLVNGETESVLTGVTASGTGKNAGSYSSKATGSDSNYNLTFIDGSLDIAKAQLHLNAVSDTRTYDGTNASTGLVSITGLQGNDSASATQVFDSRNAGNRTLNVTGVVINDGNNGNNYIVQTQNATGTINKALITQVDGITANSRFFDGTTNATLNFNNSQLLGKITGDDLYVASAQGQFSDLGIGQDKTVNINNIQLAGADAANYQLIKNTAQTTANMTLLTPTGYLQAIQFQPVTDHQIQPQNSARIDVQNGGVNINGLQVMKGGY
ncbi:hypothetical protein A7A69_01235 [Acinetobacter sp. Ac_1271]|nr:hypothetical protein [Acinetobacter guerrae]